MDKDCVFCKIMWGGRGSEIEMRLGKLRIFHIEPLNPVTPGHRVFIPLLHYSRAETYPIETGEVFEQAAKWAGDQGVDYNLIVNSGPYASQTIHHLHVHYVPRTKDDGLKLPWTEQKIG